MLRLFLDPSSPSAVSAAASLFGSQALQGASRKRLHAWFRVIAVPSSIDGASLEVFLPIGVRGFVTADDHIGEGDKMIEGSKICPWMHSDPHKTRLENMHSTA
jgi:hypothetical protein